MSKISLGVIFRANPAMVRDTPKDKLEERAIAHLANDLSYRMEDKIKVERKDLPDGSAEFRTQVTIPLPSDGAPQVGTGVVKPKKDGGAIDSEARERISKMFEMFGQNIPPWLEEIPRRDKGPWMPPWMQENLRKLEEDRYGRRRREYPAEEEIPGGPGVISKEEFKRMYGLGGVRIEKILLDDDEPFLHQEEEPKKDTESVETLLLALEAVREYLKNDKIQEAFQEIEEAITNGYKSLES